MKTTLHIITELFPPDETSTGYILGEIANACTKEYEVHVICGPEVYDTRKKPDLEHPFDLNPTLRIHRVQGLSLDKNRKIGKALSFIMMTSRMYQKAKKTIGEKDKVLMVTNPAPLVLLLSHLRKRRHFNLNVLVHDVFPENTVPAGLQMPLAVYRLAKRLFDRAYSRVDRFITIGRDMAEIVRNKAGQKAEIKIVENWAEIDAISPRPFPGGSIKLEYAGNIGRVQGLDRLVRELPEGVELHFFGTGARENVLKEMHHPNVYFHGPYFRSQQQEVLGACHAAIVSLSNGMYGLGVPSKAYNIMAAGRPIIYFGPEKGEIGLMVKENHIGSIGWPPKWDLDELQQMGERARSLAETNYSKIVILEKFLIALR